MMENKQKTITLKKKIIKLWKKSSKYLMTLHDKFFDVGYKERHLMERSVKRMEESKVTK